MEAASQPPPPVGHLIIAAPTMAKDSRWLTLEVCREHNRSKCPRSGDECRFAHPPPNVEIQNGRVVCCFDSIKGRCQRQNPGCKYFHPPSHLREVLLQNGRQNLLIRQLAWQRQLSHSFPITNLVPMQMILNQPPIATSQNNHSSLLPAQCLSWPSQGVLPAQTMRPSFEGTNIYLPPPPASVNVYETLDDNFQNLELYEKNSSPPNSDFNQNRNWQEQFLQAQIPMCVSIQCKPMAQTAMDLMSKSQFFYETREAPQYFAPPPLYTQNTFPQWQYITSPGLPMSFCPTVIPQY